MELSDLIQLHKKIIELREFEQRLLTAGHIPLAHELRVCVTSLLNNTHRVIGEKFVQNMNDENEGE